MEGYNSRYVVTSLFLEYYLDTEEEGRLDEVAEKASLIGYSRMIRKIRKQREQDETDNLLVRRCVERIAELTDRLDSLTF